MTYLPHVLVVVAIWGAAYWFLLRPVLIQRADLATFFTKNQMEKAGWRARLGLMFGGLKTMLVARFLILAGIMIPFLDNLMGIDLATMLPPISVTKTWEIAPSQYVPLVVLPSIGFVQQKLRNVTTTPVGVPSLEQVAAVIPSVPMEAVVQKTEAIAASKTPPSLPAASGKD